MVEVFDADDKRAKLLLECNCVNETMSPHTCHIDEWVNWFTTIHNDGNNYVCTQYFNYILLYIMMVTTMYAHSTLITYYYT